MNAQDLKNSVLQMAVQGKLVEQNLNDEPASVLLEKIKEEKEKLIKEGKIKKEKPLPEITEEEKSFEIPEGWEWVRLGKISKLITKGTTPRGGNVAYEKKGVGFLRAENVLGMDKLNLDKLKYISYGIHNGYLKRSILEENDLLITIAGTLGRTGIVKKDHLPLNINQAIAIVRMINIKDIDLTYLIVAINAPLTQKKLVEQKKITAIPNLTLEIVANCVIPLPPLAEQQRIVSKLNELMPKIDAYGKTEVEKEALQLSFPYELKKSILQYAIQGKLVEQNPNDEPASVLLEKIKKEKQQLIKEGKIKKDKPLPEITEEEKSFEIPEGWEWVRLGEVVRYGAGYPVTYNDVNDSTWVLDLEDIEKDTSRIINRYYYKDRKFKSSKIKFNRGDILYGKLRPYLNKVVIANQDGVCSSEIVPIRIYSEIDPKYLLYVLRTPYFISYVNKKTYGTKMPRLGTRDALQIVIPIAPYEEQRLIVEKDERLS